ncbi:MAG: indolepyruvate ferredoxin oxidoreductase subunit alpha [Ardenticatenaceae bacterium]|nr:indolepyruvate ferredoxin oxidoreductase subunit alpha [Ardenticatenaceae bacterium]
MIREVLLGNEAIGRGLVEGGCRLVAAYPGTPSSEVLPAVVRFKEQLGLDIYAEWSINEKSALEVALAASWSGLRAAAVMKQVGLNVAADPLLSAAYTGVNGGLVIVVADDPGLHSSQTEQDSRLFGLFAKVPVLDPSTPQEARAMARAAFELSERFKVPVILRPTIRICHGKQDVLFEGVTSVTRPVRFEKDPTRWAATPRYRFFLHKELNEKLARIETEFESSPLNSGGLSADGNGRHHRLGIVAGGVCHPNIVDLLAEVGLSGEVPVLKIGTPYPLPPRLLAGFAARCDHVLILEEPDAVIELQLDDRRHIHGRLDGTVPNAGELTPEVLYEILSDLSTRLGLAVSMPALADPALDALLGNLDLPVRKPRLCPGCSHRSSFFAIRRSLPKAIYPGDIGCYTLGTNLRAVDTVLDMGASVNMAAGFYQAYKLAGEQRPIVATIGDSTFLHSGITGLANAVHTGARFILVILDNTVTAMTGFQPTPDSERLADGRGEGTRVRIQEIVRAVGVRFIRQVDPYEIDHFKQLLKEAEAFTKAPDGGVAVILAERACVLYDPSPVRAAPIKVTVDDACDGCKYCLVAFECPALVMNVTAGKVEIDRRTCVDCGECIDSCYKGLIIPM